MALTMSSFYRRVYQFRATDKCGCKVQIKYILLKNILLLGHLGIKDKFVSQTSRFKDRCQGNTTIKLTKKNVFVDISELELVSRVTKAHNLLLFVDRAASQNFIEFNLEMRMQKSENELVRMTAIF